MKIGPFFSSVANMARRLVEAGADGLVLFNRFMQPDIDLETLRVDPSLHLSTTDELRLPLRWIAILRGQVHASLAATTGVHTAEDAREGAPRRCRRHDDGLGAVPRTGPSTSTTVLDGIETWLDEHEYESVEQLKGS